MKKRCICVCLHVLTCPSDSTTQTIACWEIPRTFSPTNNKMYSGDPNPWRLIGMCGIFSPLFFPNALAEVEAVVVSH